MRERFEIRIRGLLGPLLRRVLGDLRIRTLPRQSTIRGRLSAADLERLLDRLDRSGVEVVCLSSVAPPGEPDAGVRVIRAVRRTGSRPERSPGRDGS